MINANVHKDKKNVNRRGKKIKYFYKKIKVGRLIKNLPDFKNPEDF
jgi:hypothetical protein